VAAKHFSGKNFFDWLTNNQPLPGVKPMADSGSPRIMESDLARRNREFEEGTRSFEMKALGALLDAKGFGWSSNAAAQGDARRSLAEKAAYEERMKNKSSLEELEAKRMSFRIDQEQKKDGGGSDLSQIVTDLRDVVNSDLVRIGGARGIGALGDQGLELQKSLDRKTGELVGYAKQTAEAIGKFTYA